jgi:hypothetical protein
MAKSALIEQEQDEPGGFGVMDSSETEAQRQERELREEIQARVDAFGMSLAASRSAAISARQVSGIEEIWTEDQEFFEGVDDLNRHDERRIRTDKPPQGGGQPNTSRSSRNQSRVFPNITCPIVESAAAHICDVLIPANDRPWSYEPTPIPEIDELAEQYAADNPEGAQALEEGSGMAAVDDPMAAPQRGASEAQDQGMVSQGDTTPEAAFEQTEIAKSVAEATQTRVWDWHVEGQFNAHIRRVIEDAARLGVGVLKGPFPVSDERIGWEPERESEDEVGNPMMVGGDIKISQDIKPKSKRVDPWNFFPAAGCGEDIQAGDSCWERDFITKRQLRKLMRDDTYLGEQIKLCLKEGPAKALAEAPQTISVEEPDPMGTKYELWYGHVQAEEGDLEAAGCDCEGIEDPYVDCMVVLVNNRVIKATLPATEYTGFPYDLFCWKKRQGHWAGIGISRQVRTAQKIVVGATRTMMNNAGLAGGPIIVFKQGVVVPADGVAGIAPRKVYYIKKDDQTIADATKAIGSIKVDILVNELLAIIQFGLQMSENNSGFPMLLQGQMGKAPDRVGVVQVLDKNTNAIKRGMARVFSDDLMGPHLRRYYVYHLMYGPDDEKGDLQINVKGYTYLVERDIRLQEIGQMYQIVLDPRFGLDPKKWAEEFLKSRHLNYDDLALDDEKWAELLENWAQMMEQGQQGDPRVQVAQINAQARLQGQQMSEQTKGAIAISELQYHEMKDELDRQLELLKISTNKELDVWQQDGSNKQALEKIKADLAKKVMEIQSTFELARLEAPARRLPEPPVEPPGLAPEGQSFTQ